MPRKLIITRAEPGAGKTAGRLKALRFDVVCLPAIELVFHDAAASAAPAPGDILIFTSANGVRAFQKAGWAAEQKAICVGDATMKIAAEAGFSEAYSAEGDVEAVLSHILKTYAGSSAPEFVHVANEVAVGDLARRLNAAGYKARFLALYGARPVHWSAVAARWHDEIPDNACIIIHSAKGAESVAEWIKAGGLSTEHLALAGLSHRAIAPLDGHNFAAKAVAKHPNEHELRIALQTITQPGVS